MKLQLSLALFVIVGLVACSQAVPARKRMAYYQQQQQRYWARPQRLMYMQYVQPSHGTGRSAAAALVAGDTVATGTYLQDCNHADTEGAAAVAGPTATFAAESSQTEEDTFTAAGAHSAHSVAEAYPEDQISVKVDLDADKSATVGVGAASASEETYVRADDDAKEGREYHYGAPDVEVSLSGQATDVGVDVSASKAVPAESEGPAYQAAGAGSVDINVNVPAPAPAAFTPAAAAAKPARGYLPSKKKVYVQLEQSSAEAAESEDDNAIALQDDDEEDETDVAPPKYPTRAPNGRYPVAKKPAKPSCANCGKAAKPLPAGTFFPVDFGGATGGAIAIANSFSTGEGGSATSHAIAYGNPDQARARVPARHRRH